MIPEMTSERIVSVLSNQWFKVKEIVDIMGIKDPLDIIYLKSKLKGLYRKGKIEYVYHLNDIYWKLNKEEFTIQDNLSLDFYREMVDKDPFDIDAWAELGFLYHEIIQNNEAIHCFEAVLNLDPFDAKS